MLFAGEVSDFVPYRIVNSGKGRMNSLYRAGSMNEMR